jgi:hypothetical protein
MLFRQNIKTKPNSVNINLAHPINRGLVGYWSMFESDGKRINDLSPYRNNGLMTGGIRTGTDRGRGVNFRSANSEYATVPDFSVLSIPNQITITGWLLPSDSVAFSVVMCKGHDSDPSNRPENYTIDNGSDGLTFRFYYTNLNAGTYNFQIYSSSGFFSVSTPVHFAICVDYSTTSTTTLYKNGALVSGTWSGGGVSPATNTDNLTIGTLINSGSPVAFYNGVMDEFRIYNRMLTVSEVNQLYSTPYIDRLSLSNITEFPVNLVWLLKA